MVKMYDLNKAKTVAESISTLNKGEMKKDVTAEIMVANNIADDLEFYLKTGKFDKKSQNYLTMTPSFGVASSMNWIINAIKDVIIYQRVNRHMLVRIDSLEDSQEAGVCVCGTKDCPEEYVHTTSESDNKFKVRDVV